jgi:hypothetical protein
MVKKVRHSILCPSSTVVEHSTHKPKVKGSNNSNGTGRNEMVKNLQYSILCRRSTVVEHSTHNPEIKC